MRVRPAHSLSDKSIAEFFEAIGRHRAVCVAREIAAADAARLRAYKTSWIRKSENHRLEKVLELAVR